MKLHLGRVGQTTLTLHPATLVMAAYLLLRGQGALLLTAGVSIALHEAAHGVVAALCRHPPKQAEITPLGLLLRIEEEESIPVLRRVAFVAAGPCMTALLAYLAVVLTRWDILPSAVGQRLFYTNLALLAVNLLPALPLDGGRLLSALLSLRFAPTVQMKVLRVSGTILGCIVTAFAVFCAVWLGLANLSLAMVGCFLIYAAQAGTRTLGMTSLRAYLARSAALEQRRMLPCELWIVCERLPLYDALTRLREGRSARLIVVESGTQRKLGELDDAAMQAALWRDAGMTCGEALTVAEKQR